MAKSPWLTIVGVGEDGLAGLSPASREALERAEILMGPTRHLDLVPGFGSERVAWPVPFADGIPKLLAFRGRNVVALASGDPFWFGSGSVLARQLEPGEWRALPERSTFSLAASRLGWALEKTATLGLHAAPLTRLRPVLASGRRVMVLLRDGGAVRDLASYLTEEGFAEARLWIMESLGGPGERVTHCRANALPEGNFVHPVCVGIEVAGSGRSLPLASGRPDDWFEHDGQITKRPVRALTLSALTPRPYERLWDIGAGSGSISIEWLLSDPSLNAVAIEADAGRAARIKTNAMRLGADRLEVINAKAPAALEGLASPDAVFVGGGLDRGLLDWLVQNLGAGTRVVANAVTLESEALLLEARFRLGGDLLRLEISKPTAIGTRLAWRPSHPLTQWTHTL